MAVHFIKAYCDKSKQYYGLRIEDDRGTPQVTDFYDIEEGKAKELSSTINVSSLQTAPNLRACMNCAGRRVSGCDCAKGMMSCRAGQGYRFQCIYCKNLHVFSVEEGAETVDAGRIGKKVRLAQGQEVEISAAGPGALEHILVGVGWDIARTGDASMDIDSSVIVKSGRGLGSELVYFSNKLHPSGCVVHMGDNLVGGKYSDVSEDSENINVYLNKVPADRDQLYFVLNIYSCNTRRQTFRDVRNMYIRLTNAKNRQVLAEYRVDHSITNQTGMVIGKAYRKGGKWVFQAIGRGVKVASVHELDRYCI